MEVYKMEKSKDFSTLRLNHAWVVRGDVDDLKKLNEIVAASLDKLEIEPVYQKSSPARLVIEEKVGGEKDD